MSNSFNGPVAAPATSVPQSPGQGAAPMGARPTLSDNVATVLSQYELCKSIAGYCASGDDFANLATTSKKHWAAVYNYLRPLKRSKTYRLQCDGSGLLRWGGQNQHVWQGGDKFRCLDDRLLIPCARPCDGCGVAVCNICRFHIDRTTASRGSAHPKEETPFKDDLASENSEKLLWRDAKYTRLWERGSGRPRTDREKAETILADQWRIYCDRHMCAKKTELMRRLKPRNLPGEYCSCNPGDRFVRNSWFCIPCVEVEYNKVREDTGRSRRYCSEPRCQKPANQIWKQCSWCGSLIDKYTPKGRNVTYIHK